MASGLNKVFLLGRLGNDPEVRYTTNGGAVANFNVATNESWTDKQGQKQERTEWHRVVVWGKLGELCGQYLTKGRQAFLEGKLQTREWTDKEGAKRYTTEIVAQNVQFIGGPNDRANAGASDFNQASSGADFGDSPGVGHGASNNVGGGGGGGSVSYQKAESPISDDEVPF